MITAEQFLGDIRIDVNRCPDPLIERELRKAIIYLCEQAQVWLHTDYIDFIPGECDYEISVPDPEDATLPAQADVHSIVGAWHGLRILEPANHHDIGDELRLASGKTSRRSIGLLSYTAGNRGKIQLLGEPGADETDQLRFSVSLKPSRVAEEYPDFLSSDYHETIVHGATGYLMMMTGREWSNTELGTWHRRKFDERVIEARQEVDRAHSTNNQRLKPRRFAPGRRHR